jgi:hypothetical protein
MMDAETSIKELRRKTYLAYHQDGIIDILLGTSTLGFTLWIMSDNIVFGSLTWFSFVLYVLMKNNITIPRFGYVRFDENKKHSQLSIGLGIGVLLLVILIAVAFFVGPGRMPASLETFIRSYHLHIMGVLGALVLLIVGWISGVTRLFLYALAIIAGLGLSLWYGFDPRIAFLFVGVLEFVIGFFLLATFLRRYPARSMKA